MPTHELWLARHGETAWSLSGQHTGRTDLALTENGERQAEALGRYLAGRPFAKVFTSPLRRARQTCEIAGYAAVAEVHNDLAEWHYGELEGRTGKEYTAEHPDWLLWRDGPPGGETLAQVAGRARNVIASALAVEGPVLLFAHGHLLRILAATWIEADPALAQNLALKTAAVSILALEQDVRVLSAWNLSAE